MLSVNIFDVQQVICSVPESPELADIKVIINTNVSELEPTTMDYSGEVIIINAHSEEEAEFLHQIFIVPQYIYDEMTALGWSYFEQRDFVRKMRSMSINRELAWDAYKKGMNADEIIEQKLADDIVRSKLLNDYVGDKIEIEEYMDKYPLFLEEKSVAEVKNDAIASKGSFQQKWIAMSGLTATEMDYCRSVGMMKVFDMFNAKNISTKSEISFNEVVQAKLDSKDWDEALAKLGLPYEGTTAGNDAPESADTAGNNEYHTGGGAASPKPPTLLPNNVEEAILDPTPAEENPPYDDGILVKLNGKYLTFPGQLPIIADDRTLVPLRIIFEALGAKVDWVEETMTVIAVKSDIKIILQIGSSDAMVDDEIKVLDVPAQLINGRTLVPLRFVSEAMGAKVDWIPGEGAKQDLIIIDL